MTFVSYSAPRIVEPFSRTKQETGNMRKPHAEVFPAELAACLITSSERWSRERYCQVPARNQISFQAPRARSHKEFKGVYHRGTIGQASDCGSLCKLMPISWEWPVRRQQQTVVHGLPLAFSRHHKYAQTDDDWDDIHEVVRF